MRNAVFAGSLLGVGLLVWLVVRVDFAVMLQALALGGWTLLWLIPYRALYFLLYAAGWFNLLRAYDPRRAAGLAYLFWATAVRDAIDRLLPVASVGGGVAAVRLLHWRGLAIVPASASVIVEILLTLIVSYLFTAVGLFLLSDLAGSGPEYHRVLLAFLISLPVPVITAALLRHGSLFRRLQGFLRALVGDGPMADGAASLDREVRASLGRGRTMLIVGTLQFLALISGSLEVWFVLRLFGHPVGPKVAVVLESMTQAIRHLAFVVPAGLGVQEAALVLFGHALGISSELALAVSMAKRMREVLCSLPSLLSWQWLESQRLQKPMRNAS